MTGDHDPIELHPNPYRLAPIALVSGILALLCGVLAWLVPWASSCFEILAAGTAIFGVVLAWAIFRIVRPGTTLVIDHDGLIDRTTVIAAGRLAWGEIERVTTFKFMAQKYVGIWVKDVAALTSRLPAVRARLIEKNVRKGYPPVWIPAAMVATPPQVLADLIALRLARMARPA
jgi:hypothetical protein